MRRPHRPVIHLALTVVVASIAGFGTSPICVSTCQAQERTLSPYFVVESEDSAVDRFPLLSTATAFTITGVIADVVVKQTYQNDGQRPLHAKYVFPASGRAAVHGLTMTIGNEIIYAKIKEREEAQREFQAAKEAGQNAALLEQQRPNVFTMDVANLIPGQRIDVELHYSELLVPEGGVYQFISPTVVGPRYSTLPAPAGDSHDQWVQSPYSRENEPPRYSFDLTGQVRAGMAVQEITSPSHSVQAQWQSPAQVEVTLDPADRDGGNRDFVLQYRLDSGRIESGLMLYEGEPENFFLVMLEPPRRVTDADIPAREYVFVVDVSGSMSGFPLDTAKSLLRDLIGQLRPQDTFNVLFFAGGSQLWSPESKAANPAHLREALAMIDKQRGGGGTELLAAVRQALELPMETPRSRSIVVVTDGYIAAEKEVFTYIRSHLNQANVFAFGIGSSVNRHLIEGVARAGLGEPFVVLGPDEARNTARRFREYIQHPVLTNIEITFEGLDAYDLEPASIPDVLADRPVIVRGKWKGPARGRIHVQGHGGTGRFEHSFEVTDAASEPDHRPLRQLWARARAATLSDYNFGQESAEEKRQLIELGLTYDLLTRHTSFIAVHEFIRNETANAEDVTQPLPLPAGVSDAAVGTMEAGSEPGLIPLFIAMGAGGLALAARRRQARSCS